MKNHKSRSGILMIIDLFAIVLSFVISYTLRSVALSDSLGITFGFSTYFVFLAEILFLYLAVSLVVKRPRTEELSVSRIFLNTIEQQAILMAAFMVSIFVFRKSYFISRVFVALQGFFNVLLCSVGRLLYRKYCMKDDGHRTISVDDSEENVRHNTTKKYVATPVKEVRHVFIIGSKSIGCYGGYESFVMNLLQQHEGNTTIQYHVVCKANGSGFMDLKKLKGAVSVNDEEFIYCNAHCVLIPVREKLGSAQAVFYDISAFNWVCEYVEKNHIQKPIVYILASRIGPFEKKYVKFIHSVSGVIYQNPDGHEDWRGKWSLPVRKYWKYSERRAVKNADLVICDSKIMEEYIQDEYSEYVPKTIYISYGSDATSSNLKDDDSRYAGWLMNHNLVAGEFYTVVGRCVPENNIDSIIREFMLSNSQKDLAIITTDNPKMLKDMENRLHFKSDKRIKFVGTVYDQEMLKKIRENSYGYVHGHSVGGTNPSLLEALGSTNLNFLYDVNFNREVAGDAALYWNLDVGSLARLIDYADTLPMEKINEMGLRAKRRIVDDYSWESICDKYRQVFEKI